jgi:small subunit ribosomal protein S2
MATAQTEVGIRELLEAGVHFGHQTRRWNPKMRRFIFGEREGIYIIDLLKTDALLRHAQEFASGVARRGGTVLFVGTKKQARDAIKDAAQACGMPFVNHRWLGGLLTNFQTISLRIKRLHDLERYAAEGQLELLPTRERLAAEADLEKLQANLGGVKHMQRVPDAVFVIDLKTEAIAVREAQRLRIPIIGLVDTNCDPDGIDYVVPGNDDAMRACGVIANAVASVVQENRVQWQAAEEERVRREAEEAARRAAEEQARKEAEEAARAEAEAAAAAQTEEDLVSGGEGMPRQEAEQVVADAVARRGRPPVEGRRAAEAGAAAQASDEEAMPRAGAGRETLREHENPNVGERVPQEAGAPQGQGAPASDTAEGAADTTTPVADAVEKPASRARQKARRAKQEAEAPPAPEPGPSEAAQEAMQEAPPAEPAESPAAEAPPGAQEAEDASVVDRAQEAANAAVDTAQDVANTAVDTAQDAVSGAADAAAGAAETVEDAAPGPLKGPARAAKRAAKAVADVTENTEQEGDAAAQTPDDDHNEDDK